MHWDFIEYSTGKDNSNIEQWWSKGIVCLPSGSIYERTYILPQIGKKLVSVLRMELFQQSHNSCHKRSTIYGFWWLFAHHLTFGWKKKSFNCKILLYKYPYQIVFKRYLHLPCTSKVLRWSFYDRNIHIYAMYLPTCFIYTIFGRWDITQRNVNNEK